MALQMLFLSSATIAESSTGHVHLTLAAERTARQNPSGEADEALKELQSVGEELVDAVQEGEQEVSQRSEPRNPWEAVMSLVVWTMFTAIFAYYYRGSRPDWDPQLPLDATSVGWSTGVCDCMRGRFSTNFMACCCPAVLWAETVSDAGLQSFWKAYAMYTLGALVSLLPCASPIDAALATWDRHELREKLGMPAANTWTFLSDCLCYCCCSPCMLAQEARHVESLMEKP